MSKLINNKFGFTLAELLVVVAIIAILVAISIAVFTSNIEKARATTCDANRRSLKAELTVDYESGKEFSNGIVSDTTIKNDYGSDFDFDTFCPDHGELIVYFDGNSFNCYCSEHKPTSFGYKKIMESLRDICLDKANGYVVDSGANNISTSYAKKLSDAFKSAGLDLEKMGAKSWQFDGRNKFFFWSQQDFSTLSPGATVPVIRYNMSSGTYTVWKGTIKEGDLPSSDGSTYNSINVTQAYSPSTTQPKDQQTYKNALEKYQQALEE